MKPCIPFIILPRAMLARRVGWFTDSNARLANRRRRRNAQRLDSGKRCCHVARAGNAGVPSDNRSARALASGIRDFPLKGFAQIVRIFECVIPRAVFETIRKTAPRV